MASAVDSNDMTITAYLKKVIGDVVGDLVPLMSNDVTVGRSSSNIPILDINVSRYHCHLKREGVNWFVTDLKSLNGTYVDNEHLKPNTPYQLKDGCVIYIGPPKEAPAAFLFSIAKPDKLQQEVITEGNHKMSVESFDSNSNKSNVISSTLKRKSEPKTSDDINDLQRKRSVPTISSLLDEDDGDTSDSSISSMDSLNTRIRKLCAAEKKKIELKHGVKLQVPPPSPESCNNPQQNYESESSTTGVASTKGITPKQRAWLRAEFAILNALCYEPESSTDTISGNENSESLLNDNVTVGEPHTFLAKQTQMEQDEIEKEKLDAVKRELEIVKAREKKNFEEGMERLLEHFSCIICAELIDEPMVLNCAHTMCQYCLLKWKKKQNRCPICREKIVTEIKNLLIRNFIDKTVDQMDAEYQANRKELVSSRRKEMESWTKKKNKRSRKRRNRGRSSGIRVMNDVREVSSNVGEQSVVDLSSSSESEESYSSLATRLTTINADSMLRRFPNI
ncbi:e3 ubiquitin-protein ligase rnf8 [Nephila pilipes]|uniref:E3 ubiquitin-protein ligase CHFR n=1 Tax=Nephila pilipes TaxID=299642 RepID=A0A8X6MZ42_NEPPI|nr:e3 ubiquitin-protein ligase rnf8 [Nephila pilipes]